MMGRFQFCDDYMVKFQWVRASRWRQEKNEQLFHGHKDGICWQLVSFSCFSTALLPLGLSFCFLVFSGWNTRNGFQVFRKVEEKNKFETKWFIIFRNVPHTGLFWSVWNRYSRNMCLKVVNSCLVWWNLLHFFVW